MRRDGEHWAQYLMRLLEAFLVEITALVVVGLWYDHPVVLVLGVFISMGAVVYAAADEGEIMGWLTDLVCLLLLNRISLTIVVGARVLPVSTGTGNCAFLLPFDNLW